ncbi:hypothetical protein H7Y40_00495 [Pedobacter sp.]|nr:hypothetical protein [Candidatus Saccharibacteria bacterium]
MTFDESKEALAAQFVYSERFKGCDTAILSKLKEHCVYLYINFHDANEAVTVLRAIRGKLNDDFEKIDYDAAVITLWYWALVDATIRVCQLLDTSLRNETASLPFITRMVEQSKNVLNISDISPLQFEAPEGFKIIKDLRDMVLIHVDPKKFDKTLEATLDINYLLILDQTLTETIEPWFGTIMNTFFEQPKSVYITSAKAENILELLKNRSSSEI